MTRLVEPTLAHDRVLEMLTKSIEPTVGVQWTVLLEGCKIVGKEKQAYDL